MVCLHMVIYYFNRKIIGSKTHTHTQTLWSAVENYLAKDSQEEIKKNLNLIVYTSLCVNNNKTKVCKILFLSDLER